MRSALAAVAVVLTGLVACGEPPVDVEIPAREQGQHVLDRAAILDDEVAARLREIADQQGLDIVALTYETRFASCGEAFRAGGAFVRQWEGDIAIVSVAEPGGFIRPAGDREACFGVQPLDDFAVSSGVREEIVEGLTPPLTRENRWSEAFLAAADRLAATQGE